MCYFSHCKVDQDDNTMRKPRTDFVDNSTLINSLNAYNSYLAKESTNRRIYDINTSQFSTNDSETRAISGRTLTIMLADGRGAWRGGTAGAKYGSLFSPSGAIAGGVVGGILCGAAYSAIAWRTTAPMIVVNGSEIDNMVTSERVYDVLPFYEIYHSVSEDRVSEIINQSDVAFAADSVFLQIGALHNAMLDILTSSTLRYVSETRSSGGSMPPAWNPDDLRPSLVPDPVINSPAFQVEYGSFVADAIAEPLKVGVAGSSGDVTVSEYVVDLFSEACLQFVNSLDDLDSIIDQYYTRVNGSSELTQTEKDCLYSMLAVVAYSARYWKL